jgi:hypothetical protein
VCKVIEVFHAEVRRRSLQDSCQIQSSATDGFAQSARAGDEASVEPSTAKLTRASDTVEIAPATPLVFWCLNDSLGDRKVPRIAKIRPCLRDDRIATRKTLNPDLRSEHLWRYQAQGEPRLGLKDSHQEEDSEI